MMAILTSIVLGLVEGVTEFLPISSTGHLILVNQWFSFGQPFTRLFDIVIQSGAILAIVILFWKDIWPVSKPPLPPPYQGEKRSPPDKGGVGGWPQTWLPVLIAFIPTAIIGFLFGRAAQDYLFTPVVVAAALIFYGLIFLLLEGRKPRTFKINVTYTDALFIGLIQSLALVPGTSRSGATIVGLLFLGYARPAAARFSFLLAIPTLLAAGGYSLIKYHDPISSSEFGYLAVGFMVSLLSAYLVSRWFLAYISQKSFKPFAWYRIILGLTVIIALIWG